MNRIDLIRQIVRDKFKSGNLNFSLPENEILEYLYNYDLDRKVELSMLTPYTPFIDDGAYSKDRAFELALYAYRHLPYPGLGMSFNLIYNLYLEDSKSYNYNRYHNLSNQIELNNHRGHYPDAMGKTAYHPTFSTDSPYSGYKNPYNPNGITGGTWGDNFYLLSNSLILDNWDINRTIDYLLEAEDNGVLLLMPDGSLPLLDNGDFYGGVLPNAEVIEKKKFDMGGNLYQTGGGEEYTTPKGIKKSYRNTVHDLYKDAGDFTHGGVDAFDDLMSRWNLLEDTDVRDYFKSYVNSLGFDRIRLNLRKWWEARHPYKKYLSWLTYNDTAKDLKLNTNKSDTKVFNMSMYDNLSFYSPYSDNAYVGTLGYDKYPYHFAAAHEYAHGINLLPSYDLGILREVLDLNTNTNLSKDEVSNNHDSLPDEKHSDAWGTKYLLYKEGIYDSRSNKDVTPELILKLRDKYPELRFLKLMDNNKAAWMLNHTANNNVNNSNIIAKGGNLYAEGDEIYTAAPSLYGIEITAQAPRIYNSYGLWYRINDLGLSVPIDESKFNFYGAHILPNNALEISKYKLYLAHNADINHTNLFANTIRNIATATTLAPVAPEILTNPIINTLALAYGAAEAPRNIRKGIDSFKQGNYWSGIGDFGNAGLGILGGGILGYKGLQVANSIAETRIPAYGLYRTIGRTTPKASPVEPIIRTKVGDVEIDNPGLYYHQSSAGKAKNFVSTGRMRTPLEEYWLAKELAGEHVPIMLRTGIEPGYPQVPGRTMFSQGNLWYGLNPRINPDLLVTAEEMPIASRKAGVMSHKASLKKLENQGSRRVTSDNIYGQGPHNTQNTSAYTWEPGYGYRRVFAEETPTISWQQATKPSYQQLFSSPERAGVSSKVVTDPNDVNFVLKLSKKGYTLEELNDILTKNELLNKYSFVQPTEYVESIVGADGKYYPIWRQGKVTPYGREAIFGKDGKLLPKAEIEDARAKSNEAVQSVLKAAQEQGLQVLNGRIVTPDGLIQDFGEFHNVGITSDGRPVIYDAQLNTKSKMKNGIAITPENASSILPEQWTAAQDAAIARGDMAEAQRLRDLHATINDYHFGFYHETETPFNSFNRPGKNSSSDILSPFGVFTKSTDKSIGLGEYQMPLNVRYKNPLHLKDKGELFNMLPEDLQKEINTLFKYKGNNSNQTLWNKRAYLVKQRIGKFLGDNGYDALKIDKDWAGTGLVPNERWTDATIVPSPGNVKSPSAITYDDNGVRIPLGLRDDFKLNDIRYGIIPLLGTGAALSLYNNPNNKFKSYGGNLYIRSTKSKKASHKRK